MCTDLDADVAIIGVPFDQGTFGRPGARFGPDAIRDVPREYNYSDPYGAQTRAGGLYDIDVEDELLRGVTMADCGNITVVPSDVVENFGKLTTVVEKVVERGSFPAVVGGDHSITFPVVRGLGPKGVAELIPQVGNLYITFDIDVMDPNQPPGTGTPETGEMFYHEARECLTALVNRSNLTAFDMVEVAPLYDSSEVTIGLAARLIVDIIAARFPSK